MLKPLSTGMSEDAQLIAAFRSRLLQDRDGFLSSLLSGTVQPSAPLPYSSHQRHSRNEAVAAARPTQAAGIVSHCWELALPPKVAHGAEGAAGVSWAMSAMQSELIVVHGAQQKRELRTGHIMGQNNSTVLIPPPSSQMQSLPLSSQAPLQNNMPASASTAIIKSAVSVSSGSMEVAAQNPLWVHSWAQSIM